jgi:hypothetical protein
MKIYTTCDSHVYLLLMHIQVKNPLIGSLRFLHEINDCLDGPLYSIIFLHALLKVHLLYIAFTERLYLTMVNDMFGAEAWPCMAQ